MDAIIEALAVGIRVTLWIFKQIFLGYADTVHWFLATSPFPFLRLAVALLLSGFLVWFWSITG
jgi:hypothetical protein